MQEALFGGRLANARHCPASAEAQRKHRRSSADPPASRGGLDGGGLLESPVQCRFQVDGSLKTPVRIF